MADGEVRNDRRSLGLATSRVAGSAESRYVPTGLRPEIARIVEALARAAVPSGISPAQGYGHSGKKMSLRAAIYARFSSDLQRDRSIDDQISLCREYAARQGYEIVAVVLG